MRIGIFTILVTEGAPKHSSGSQPKASAHLGCVLSAGSVTGGHEAAGQKVGDADGRGRGLGRDRGRRLSPPITTTTGVYRVSRGGGRGRGRGSAGIVTWVVQQPGLAQQVVQHRVQAAVVRPCLLGLSSGWRLNTLGRF